MLKFINRTAIVEFNFYTLNADYGDVVARLEIFRGCLKVKDFH